MPEVEERVSKLEEVLQEFIVNVEHSHLRTEEGLRRLHEEIEDFKNATLRFQAESEKDRKALHGEFEGFKAEAEKDRKALHEEFEGFKAEAEKDRKALHEEFERFQAESEKDRKALHKEMAVFKEEMNKFRQRVDAFIEKMERFSQEQKEENRRKNKEWSAIAKKMGTIVEDLIAPALRPVLGKYFNCEVSMEGQRIFRRKDGEDFEIDAIAMCDDKVFMIEANSTPRWNDIEYIKEKGERFFEFFPEYRGKELVVIFGSISFPENIIRQASKNRIYVLAWREWEYMDILNFDEVKK